MAGIDEAGRGCLAGPVVAAALILPEHGVPPGIDDSKKLSPARREELFEQLCASRSVFAWGLAQVGEIDRLNILQATFLAMRRAIANLTRPPDALLVDGAPLPDCDLPQRALVRGDATSLSIAAASIVAKVVRDRIMVALEGEFPGYGLARHKGYPTPEHLSALGELGPAAIHRASFAPVRRAVTRRHVPSYGR